MTNQIGNSWQIIFDPIDFDDEYLSSFLEEYFEVLACDYTDDGKIQYIGYMSNPINTEELENTSTFWEAKLPEYRTEFIPAANWLTKNVIKFDPIETTDFLIYGSHEEKIPQAKNKIGIQIYAATAFGSGQHQTTKSCLNLISDLKLNDFQVKHVLDMGCGSGILALATLKLWKEAKATAVDIDDEAVIVTLQNAANNNLADRIEAFQSNGYEKQTITENGPYDLILSNILARPLIEMASDLSQNLKSGGYAIISGFIDEQVDWVVNAHQEHGLSLIKIYENENWRAVLMEKK